MPHAEAHAVPHVAADFISRVIAVVEAIPAGRVMSYSDVAAAIGSRAARAVGQVMSHYGSELPWWRVVRASGEPPIDHSARALEEYRREGTALVRNRAGDYRVNMAIARHRPNAAP